MPGKVGDDAKSSWHPIIQAALRGAKKDDPAVVHKVKVSPSMIAALLCGGEPDLGETLHEDNVCCFAALCLMVSGMLRPQDVTSPTVTMPALDYTHGARFAGH